MLYYIVSDSGNMKDVYRLREQIEHCTENIDLVFGNAGYGRFASVELVDKIHFDELFDMLVKAPFLRFSKYCH